MFDSRLTAFVCTADCGSFNRAAEKLYISPPAVMKQINSLEENLGMKLLLRNSRGVSLTPAGKVIYRHAKFLFDYSERAIEEARREMQTYETTFCIGSSLLNPCKPFMDLWYRVNDSFPGYKLHIVPFEDNHEGILSEISALGEKFDFIVGVCNSVQWESHCNFQQLGVCQHEIAVPREHRLAGKKKLTISDLYGETIMMVKKGDSSVVDSIRAEISKHPEIKIEDTPQFYDIEVFNRCVQEQNIMLTLDCWREVHPGLVTVPVEWSYPIPYGLLYSLEPSEDIKLFLDMIKNERISFV